MNEEILASLEKKKFQKIQEKQSDVEYMSQLKRKKEEIVSFYIFM